MAHLSEQALRSAQPLLEYLPEPVMWIAPNYRVIWRNAAAKRVYRADSPYCYGQSHGLDHPCPEAGEPCPMALAQETQAPVSQIHAHFNGDGPEIFRVVALPLEEGGSLEFHIALGCDLLRDDLTGLFRREYWFEMASRDRALLARLDKPWSLIFLDLDDFKDFNDSYGHLAGDEFLRRTGGAILSCLRATDSACRYGGEEMVVFLPEARIEAALEVAERIRLAVKETSIATDEGDQGVTVSSGVYVARPEDSFEAALRRVDKAVYRAKDEGRDAVRVFSS